MCIHSGTKTSVIVMHLVVAHLVVARVREDIICLLSLNGLENG